MQTSPPPSPKRNIVSEPKRSTNSPSRGGNAPLFPWKLHEMLKACARKDKENVASWVSDGKAFRVHDVSLFVSEILPLFFNQTKYKSFQRQLNLWGFQRIQNGPERGAYHHKHFLRDEPNLCCRLTRQKSKKDTTKTTKTTFISKREQGWPIPSSYSSIPRNVSEGSLERMGKLNTSCSDSLDLADFDGATFHLLEQDRYDELDLEFDFYIRPENKVQKNARSGLLEELELGFFGMPKKGLETY